MQDYETDRAWGDRFLYDVGRIVGRNLLRTAPVDTDRNRATDLVLLTARPLDIAVRVRRAGYADLYPFDVTIRCERASGAKTELEKFVDGFCDWMFYGHADQQETGLSRWFLLDLQVWRGALMREGLRCIRGKRGIYSGAIKSRSNDDGTRFAYFDVRSFPPEMIIDTSVSELRL
jgi:hypothetical protein